ncbi:MAG: hypothetical protein NE327_18430, partial [Lentisphaeraceae bacterium]|nr:hypothetical protein [Lentisphaeraceae bacterium]
KYIVHTDIRLKSPKDFFCDSDSKVNLDVHPRGGTIFGPGTSENGHTYIFDPSHPDVKIGENILTYAIADERVDLVIEVLKHPTAEIKVISKVINDGEAVIEVDSRTTGADKFEWAIGTSKYVEGREKHTFTVPVKEDSLETVIRLRASNKACSVVDSESIKLTDVQLILNEKNFCSTDPAIKLEGKPQGGSFSGDGVKGTNFDPALIEFPAKETVLNIPVTYTFESDSETKEVSVFKHPEAKIELLSEEYRDGVAFFKVENTTIPFKGYSYQWEVNGENFAGKQILEEAVKLVNNQVDIKLKAFHLKFQKCIDIAQLILEEKTEEDDTTEKPDEEKFAKTFDAIKELNSQNIKFFNDFKKDVVSGKFNDSVLTSTEMKQTQSLLNFIDNVEVKELAMNAANAVKSEMDDFQAKLKEVSEAELFGPEFTHLALRLVSIFNISSISTDKIALGNNFKSMNASIKKMFENNPEMRYSTQRLIDKEFWMNNENFTQISTFWKSIEK